MGKLTSINYFDWAFYWHSYGYVSLPGGTLNVKLADETWGKHIQVPPFCVFLLHPLPKHHTTEWSASGLFAHLRTLPGIPVALAVSWHSRGWSKILFVPLNCTFLLDQTSIKKVMVWWTWCEERIRKVEPATCGNLQPAHDLSRGWTPSLTAKGLIGVWKRTWT